MKRTLHHARFAVERDAHPSLAQVDLKVRTAVRFEVPGAPQFSKQRPDSKAQNTQRPRAASEPKAEHPGAHFGAPADAEAIQVIGIVAHEHEGRSPRKCAPVRS